MFENNILKFYKTINKLNRITMDNNNRYIEITSTNTTIKLLLTTSQHTVHSFRFAHCGICLCYIVIFINYF